MLQGFFREWVIGRRTALGAFVVAILCLVLSSPGRAQVTATLSGTVEDQSGGVIPGSQVTLTNEATHDSRVEQTNGAGLYAFPSLVPGTYDIRASAKGFKAKAVTGIVLNAGDIKSVPSLDLQVGTETQTVTVSATSEMIPIESGSKVDVLSSDEIENLALEGQDTTELLKVLPGATTMSGGLGSTNPSFSDLNVTVQQSSIGSGIDLNGAINRSGTALEVFAVAQRLVVQRDRSRIGRRLSCRLRLPPSGRTRIVRGPFDALLGDAETGGSALPFSPSKAALAAAVVAALG